MANEYKVISTAVEVVAIIAASRNVIAVAVEVVTSPTGGGGGGLSRPAKRMQIVS